MGRNDLLTISEAARLVGLSKQAVEGAVTRGDLPHVVEMVPARRIRRAEIVAYADRTQGKVGRPRSQ